MEILLPAWTHHITFFVGGEGIRDDLIHFQYYCNFIGIGRRREQFGFVDIFLENTLSEVCLVGQLFLSWSVVRSELRIFFGEERLGESV